MRRARIKALANVPIRRKTLQNIEDANVKISAIKKEHDPKLDTLQNTINFDIESNNLQLNEFATLQTETFETRTVQELKQEFEKEKNNTTSNHNISMHQEFDVDMIHNQLVICKEEEYEEWHLKNDKKLPKINNPEKDNVEGTKTCIITSSYENNGTNVDNDDMNDCEISQIIHEDEIDPLENINVDKDDNLTVYKVNPTQSVRISKTTQLLDPDLNMINNYPVVTNSNKLIQQDQFNKQSTSNTISIDNHLTFDNNNMLKLSAKRKQASKQSKTNKLGKNKMILFDFIPQIKEKRRKKKTQTIVTLSSSDEETTEKNTAMPVPQVKVGPNGQLIVDEKSVLIKQTTSMAHIDKSFTCSDDEDVTSASHSKKRQIGSKAWTNWENVKFFKALNTFGTDFMLMQSLFPNRTRQELKLKFKKEEKNNRALIEKALSHQEFNTDLLGKQFAIFEEEEKNELILKNNKSHQITSNNNNSEKSRKRKRKRCRIVASSIEAYGTDDDNDNKEDSDMDIINEDVCDPLRDTNSSTTEDNMDTNNCAVKNNERNIYDVRTIQSDKRRFLRIPESRKLPSNLKNQKTVTDTNATVKQKKELAFRYLNDIEHMVPNANTLEAGSLIILTKQKLRESSKNDTAKVYMVNENYNPAIPDAKRTITLVNLSSEILAAVTTKMSS